MLQGQNTDTTHDSDGDGGINQTEIIVLNREELKTLFAGLYGEEFLLLTSAQLNLTTNTATAEWVIPGADGNPPSWLKDHTPGGKPIVPGVIQTEAFQQLVAALVMQKCPDARPLADEMRTKVKILLQPGDTAVIEASITNTTINKFGKGMVSAEGNIRKQNSNDDNATEIAITGRSVSAAALSRMIR